MSENCVSAPVLVGDVCGGVESCRVCLPALRALAGGLVMEKDTDNPGGGYGLRPRGSRPAQPEPAGVPTRDTTLIRMDDQPGLSEKESYATKGDAGISQLSKLVEPASITRQISPMQGGGATTRMGEKPARTPYGVRQQGEDARLATAGDQTKGSIEPTMDAAHSSAPRSSQPSSINDDKNASSEAERPKGEESGAAGTPSIAARLMTGLANLGGQSSKAKGKAVMGAAAEPGEATKSEGAGERRAEMEQRQLDEMQQRMYAEQQARARSMQTTR